MDFQLGIVTFNIMIGGLKSGRKEDAMDMFTAISAHGLVPNVVTYQLVNSVVRRLLHRGEIIRVVAYLSKIDEKNFSLEASSTSLILSVFSREEYRHHAKSLPENYHFLEEMNR
jgi:leucine-rich PPR motif-containing protein